MSEHDRVKGWDHHPMTTAEAQGRGVLNELIEAQRSARSSDEAINPWPPVIRNAATGEPIIVTTIHHDEYRWPSTEQVDY